MAHSQANGRYGRFADGRVRPGTDRIGSPDRINSARCKDGTIVDTIRGAQTYMTTMPTTMRSVSLTAMTVALLFVLVISGRA